MTFQGINGAVRDEMLLQLTVPVIFVQVKASNFCLFSLKEHLLAFTEYDIPKSKLLNYPVFHYVLSW